MSGYQFVIFLVLVFSGSYLMTKYVRKYSITNAVMDFPNARSSHVLPTPTGGGIAIVLNLTAGIIIFYFIDYISLNILLAIGMGGILIACIGWIDDHRHIPAGWRMLFYLLVSLWALYWSIGPAWLQQAGFLTALNHIGLLFVILGLVWLINLYNFMDGTDGLAASQAICTSMMAGILLMLSAEEGLAMICFTLAAASLGFLIWNWPGARVFMGDVGSCYIGFVFGIVAFTSDISTPLSVYIWIILLSVFISDASLTLVFRFINGRKWYSAHKEHAYQRYVQMGKSHLALLVNVIAINLLILWPTALLAWYRQDLAVYLVVFVFLVMFTLWSAIQLKFSKYETAED